MNTMMVATDGGHRRVEITLIGQKCAQIGIITCSSSLVLHNKLI